MVEALSRIDIAQRLFELGQQIVNLAKDTAVVSETGFGNERQDVASISAFSFGSEFHGIDPRGSSLISRAARPALPDPRLIRQIIRQRQLRARFFDGDLFADPAWDMLLDLTAARAEHSRVSVTSLCIASGVPPTTALRWIGQMTDAGLLERIEDETDRRRAFITLTDKAADTMARFFADIGTQAVRLV